MSRHPAAIPDVQACPILDTRESSVLFYLDSRETNASPPLHLPFRGRETGDGCTFGHDVTITGDVDGTVGARRIIVHRMGGAQGPVFTLS